MPALDNNDNKKPEAPKQVQPWRRLPGMPAEGEDEQFEAGTPGMVKSGGTIRLDSKADTGTNLGG